MAANLAKKSRSIIHLDDTFKRILVRCVHYQDQSMTSASRINLHQFRNLFDNGWGEFIGAPNLLVLNFGNQFCKEMELKRIKQQASKNFSKYCVLPFKDITRRQESKVESEDYKLCRAAARTIAMHYAAYMIFLNVCKEDFRNQKGLLKVGTKRGRANRFPCYTWEHRKTKLKQCKSVRRTRYYKEISKASVLEAVPDLWTLRFAKDHSTITTLQS